MRMLALIVVVSALIAAQESRPAATQPAPLPEHIQILIETIGRRVPASMREAKSAAIVAEQRFEIMQRGRIVPRQREPVKRELRKGTEVYTYASADAKKKAIADQKAEIQKTRQALNSAATYPSYATPWTGYQSVVRGAVGSFALNLEPITYASGGRSHCETRVMQVVDDSNVLIEIGCQTMWANRADPESFSEPIWVSGVSTSGMVDDRPREFRDLYVCVGTVRYDTALGTKTVPKIVRVDEAKYANEIKAAVAAAVAKISMP